MAAQDESDPPGRAGVNLPGAQSGDLHVEHAAGGNIYQGVETGAIVAILREYIANDRHYRGLDSKAREARQEQLDTRLDSIMRRITIAFMVLAIVTICQIILLVLLLIDIRAIFS